MDYDLASMKPSLVAAGALWLSITLITEGEWLPILEHTSRYSVSDLENVTSLLAKCLFMVHFGAHSKKYTATKQKYASASVSSKIKFQCQIILFYRTSRYPSCQS